MQIIFTVGINKGHQLPWTPVLLLLLIITTQSQNCEPFSLQTSFTRCLIKLDLCSGDPSIVPVSSPHYYRFQSCQITHCITMGADSQCKNSVSIQLEEQECYKSCCQTKQFEPQQCTANNWTLQQKSETTNGLIAIVLAICALGLLMTSFCFMVNRLECFRKKDPPKEEPQLPVWKRALYLDHKCMICDQYGAEVETVCRHSFHFQCLKTAKKEEPLEQSCLACKKTSKKLRLWCGECHERYIKISLDGQTAQQLQNYYEQAKILHLDCMQDTISAKTDVRLTSTASQD